jgi:hypothetical protein
VVHCAEQIDWLAAHKTQQPHRVFLKLNSGMNRLGFTPAAFRSAWARLNALPQVDEISLMTHFSDADGARGVAHQVAAFDAATQDLPGERCLANSAAILRHGLKNDWVRAGILSYGSAPDFPAHDILHWDLQPAMTLRSRLIAVQQLQPGDTVGYGSSFTASQPHAHRRRGLRLCRRLPAPLRHRHAGAGGRRAQRHRGPGVDGHAGGGPERPAGCRRGQRSHAVGPRPGRQRCCPSTTWRGRRLPSATS